MIRNKKEMTTDTYDFFLTQIRIMRQLFVYTFANKGEAVIRIFK